MTPIASSHIGILDYGAGNLGSVCRALAAVGVQPQVLTEAHELAGFEKIIFPGVGAAGQAMAALRARKLDAALKNHVAGGGKLFGICVGMQVLGMHSEEDNTPCLGLLPYSLKKFAVSAPVPHMGWNSLEWNKNNPALSLFTEGLALGSHSMQNQAQSDANVYYVHSYCAPLPSLATTASPTDAWPEYLLAASDYAGARFVGAVAAGRIWGTQFHVEKSGKTGLQMLRNFVERA